MQLDIKRAFLSPFSEKGWFWNLFLFGILYYITLLMHVHIIWDFPIVLPIGFPISVILFGYLIQYIHNEIHEISPYLPSWKINIFSYLKKGIECLVLMTGYITLRIIIPFIPILIISFISLLWIEWIFIGIILLFIISLSFPFITILICCYADNLFYSNNLNLKRGYKLFLSIKRELFLSSFISFTLMIAIDMLTFLTASNIVETCLFVPIILIISNLFSQCYKEAKLRLNEDIDYIKDVNKQKKGVFLGYMLFIPSVWLILGVFHLLLMGYDWAPPFLSNGPSVGKKILSCPRSDSYIQEMQFYNGLKLRVYKGNKEQGPIVSLVDNLGKVKWCIYDRFAEEITFTNYLYLPILGLRVKGDAIWGNGRADTYWYIDNKGNLKEYWFDGGAFVN